MIIVHYYRNYRQWKPVPETCFSRHGFFFRGLSVWWW